MVGRSKSRYTLILVIVPLLFLIIVEAQRNGTSSGKSKLTKQMYAYDKNKTVEQASVFRFNVLIFGGLINMTLSLVNLIFGLVNFYLIFGRYDARLRQVAGKLRIAVDEIASRDLHPKIKMSLSRVIPPNTPLLTEMMKLFKEPSKLFDNTNELFTDQKEARLRKIQNKKEKEEHTNTVKSEGSKSQQASAHSNPKSTVTDSKKKK
ncbi:hypothetical protein L5515_000496 [Caenorhabditis briggsae]|uniref:Uncharacterized protein n=3 Tax=Caenorhabditis briggsae TaxID=6238 RepID=A0AAE9DRL3_CAEBR|nr:hypothetical protein L3Y34_014415 [Caenorhabditis briggsae]UMM10985.1 hypothetical protein L5515_000496 [Caenorhabditis briggsae]